MSRRILAGKCHWVREFLVANALRCGGKRLWLWGQMPLSAWVDVFGVIME